MNNRPKLILKVSNKKPLQSTTASKPILKLKIISDKQNDNTKIVNKSLPTKNIINIITEDIKQKNSNFNTLKQKENDKIPEQ